MRLEQQVIVSRRIRGVSSPPLLAAGPVLALIAGRWLFISAHLLVFFCLSLLVIVPLGLVLVNLGLAAESDGRILTRYLISGSLTLGIVLLPFSLRNITPEGFRLSQVERLIGKCEDALDKEEVRRVFSTLSQRDYSHLSPEDHRRAAIQKARFGDWNGALLLWALDGSSIHTKEQKAVANFISYIKTQGVSQFSLKQLCIQLFWMGYEKQSVYLWRSHFRGITPADWQRPFQDY